MGAPDYISNHLNDQQIMMLRLLKRPFPEEDFIQMRRLATVHGPWTHRFSQYTSFTTSALFFT
jgi:hypothetical protein